MPPETATWYSSGWAFVGNCTFVALSSRAELKSTLLPSGVKLVGMSSAEWTVSRRASPPAAGHDEDVEVAVAVGGERDLRAVGRPDGRGLVRRVMVSGTAVPPADGHDPEIAVVAESDASSRRARWRASSATARARPLPPRRQRTAPPPRPPPATQSCRRSLSIWTLPSRLASIEHETLVKSRKAFKGLMVALPCVVQRGRKGSARGSLPGAHASTWPERVRPPGFPPTRRARPARTPGGVVITGVAAVTTRRAVALELSSLLEETTDPARRGTPGPCLYSGHSAPGRG